MDEGVRFIVAHIQERVDLVCGGCDRPMCEEAKKLLAWQEIQDEEDELRFDDTQKRQLIENIKKAERDLKESVWRSYKNLYLLAKDNQIRHVDLGLNHSGSADSITALILHKLRQDGEVVKDGPSPNLLVRNWPPAFTEWSTKSVRDAFFASPQFCRLMNPESIKDTIAKGVAEELLGYVGKKQEGKYKPFYFGSNKPLSAVDVEISDDMFIITAEEAKKQVEPPRLATITVLPPTAQVEPGKKQTFVARGLNQHGNDFNVKIVKWTATGGAIDKDGVFTAEKDEGSFVVTATAGEISGTATCIIAKPGAPLPPPPPPSAGKLVWTGEVPPQKWMNFYTKVLSKFAAGKGLKLTVSVEVSPEGGVTKQQAEETKTALRELGLNDDVSHK